MADNYIIDPSNQQGQSQTGKGIAPANKATGGNDTLPRIAPDEGPEDIPDHPGTLRKAGAGPTPLPNHPGKILKPEPGIPLPDRSGKSMGEKIGKDTPH